jgi:hypothetical protein
VPRTRPPEDELPIDTYRGSNADEIAKPEPAALHSEPVKPSVEMTPADLWAIANLKFKELPPAEYDHAPDKAVIIEDIKTEAELRVRCNWPKEGGGNLVGCTDGHHIYLGPLPGWSGLTRNIVLRHEIGHVNGWPKDHAGMR